jgi:hypothetical protein
MRIESILIGITLLSLLAAQFLLYFEDRVWFREWQVYAVLILGGPGMWLILLIWWLRSKMD